MNRSLAVVLVGLLIASPLFGGRLVKEYSPGSFAALDTADIEAGTMSGLYCTQESRSVGGYAIVEIVLADFTDNSDAASQMQFFAYGYPSDYTGVAEVADGQRLGVTMGQLDQDLSPATNETIYTGGGPSDTTITVIVGWNASTDPMAQGAMPLPGQIALRITRANGSIFEGGTYSYRVMIVE